MQDPTPRPEPPRRRFRKRWVVCAAMAVGVAAAGVSLVGVDRTVTISYGQFRRELVAGRVDRVRLEADGLTGTLFTDGPHRVPRAFRASRVGVDNDPALLDLLGRHARDWDAGAGPTPARAWAMPALAAILVGLALWTATRRGGIGSAMAFTKSRHKVYAPTSSRVSFADVAGSDEAVEELREVVDFLKTPQKYVKLGGKIPKGVLLVGPPGTGKTLLAKAVAGEAGVPFFALSGSDFLEMFVGVGAARVRNLFAQAEAQAPCLIFIDEIDAVGKARGQGGGGASDERDQTLNQLLVAMDGFSSNRAVIVLAATNRPETLDPALVRPGRFDRSVSVDRPDLGGREQILRVHTRNVPTDPAIDLRRIAALTGGFVGADLANLVNEAALLAARKGKSTVDHRDFEQGVERILAGPEKKQRVLRPEEQRRIAAHEAGHALVSRSLDGTDPVHKVTILGRGNGALGYTMYRPEDDRFLRSRRWYDHAIRGLLGGTVAEEVLYGDFSDGATSDLQRATQLARKMVVDLGMSPSMGRVCYNADGRGPDAWSEQTAREIDAEVRRILDEALAATRALVESRRDALVAVTEALFERETLDAAELDEILGRS